MIQYTKLEIVTVGAVRWMQIVQAVSYMFTPVRMDVDRLTEQYSIATAQYSHIGEVASRYLRRFLGLPPSTGELEKHGIPCTKTTPQDRHLCTHSPRRVENIMFLKRTESLFLS